MTKTEEEIIEELETSRNEAKVLFTGMLERQVAKHKSLHDIRPTVALLSCELYSYLFGASSDVSIIGLRIFQSKSINEYDIVLGHTP